MKLLTTLLVLAGALLPGYSYAIMDSHNMSRTADIIEYPQIDSEIVLRTERKEGSANFLAIFESGKKEIFRDKLNIIEPYFEPGITIRYTPGHVASNEVPGKTYAGLDQEMNLLFSVTTVGQTFKESNTILGYDATAFSVDLIENQEDCMDGTKEVCHPTLLFKTNNNSEGSAYSRGESFLTPYGSIAYITDAHTYNRYANTTNSDYGRYELLFVDQDKDPYTPYKRTSSLYCKFVVNTQYDREEQCTTRGKIIKRIERILELFKRNGPYYNDPYIVC